MDSIKLACGDNISNEIEEENKTDNEKEIHRDECLQRDDSASVSDDNITVQTIEDHESKLKDRIAQCKNVIASLKFELNAEKAKLEKENKQQYVSHYTTSESLCTSNFCICTDNLLSDVSFDASKYSACVDSKLNCDESLMEYEKQLQKYQNTLNLAQLEKKNAIRKQMLAKAYKLKLLEVENQCNIELLRVKQSLQCLEPLQMIVNKWKTGNDNDTYDLDNYELMPRFPELSTCTSSVDVNCVKDELENEKNPTAEA